jgi:TolB protein
LLVVALLVGSTIALASAMMPRSEIIFTRYDRIEVDIYRMDTLHRAMINMTPREGYDGSPSWSPNGELIAFTSDRAGALNVYIMDSLGRNVRAVTTTSDGAAFSSRWSSDGRRLYFFRFVAGREDVYQVNIDGTNFHRVTEVETRENIRRELDLDPNHLNSTISPDGRHSLYLMFRSGGWGIYMSNNDDKTPQHLANTGQQYNEPPAWSPDSERVLFVALTESGNDLFVVPATPGTSAIRLTQDHAQEAYVSWRPG